MPICRAGTKLIYFTHVPKCGGTSVEHYLSKRFGPLGMLDPAFSRRDPADAWSLTPPQHLPELVRRDLLPDTLFDAQFATVRHPALRIRSLFLFQRDIEGALPPKLSLRDWLQDLPRLLATAPYALHGHPRPMSETIPEQAKVFRMEDGLDKIIPWLDELTETTSTPGDSLPHVNKRANKSASKPIKDQGDEDMAKRPPAHLGADNLALIARIYAADYERFGYDVTPPQPIQQPTPKTGAQQDSTP